MLPTLENDKNSPFEESFGIPGVMLLNEQLVTYKQEEVKNHPNHNFNFSSSSKISFPFEVILINPFSNTMTSSKSKTSQLKKKLGS